MTRIGSWERIGIIDLALTALALASGVTDVTAFLTLGDVFTSAMTGNTALLGIALSQGRVLSATHSFSALLGFTLGASLATAIYLPKTRNKVGDLSVIRPLLLVEIFCLGIFALILTFIGRPVESVSLYGLILLSAIGMGVQGVVARQINSPGINTIVFTTTLVSIVISLTSALLHRSGSDGVHLNTKRQIGIFLAYGFGAVLAGMLAGPGLRVLAWVPMVTVLAALGCCEAAVRAGRPRREG
jgi:uncharacterized membrane protein YoaK (UPF0700 family)